MYRGTNPTIAYRMKSDFDFTKVKEVWLTIASWDIKRTYKYSEGKVVLDSVAKTISASMSQEDTLAFEGDDTVEVQMRLLDTDDLAYSTPKTEVDINSILEDGVIGIANAEGGG